MDVIEALQNHVPDNSIDLILADQLHRRDSALRLTKYYIRAGRVDCIESLQNLIRGYDI